MIGAHSIYSSFNDDLFYEMARRKLENCRFCHYDDFSNFGIFCFKTAHDFLEDPFNISIYINKSYYKYYDELVCIFKSHKAWLFKISGYNYITNDFDIIFKKPIQGGFVKQYYRVSNNGIDERYDINPLDYIEANEVAPNYMSKYFQLPICKELTTFEFNSPSGRVPTLSKPPIFNPPATICYWTDGTKTVVKCQEEDTYSPEAGLALCYMKKVLGNSSRDLNKVLHRYITEEKEG